MRNEADTRAELIDPALKKVGWSLVDHSYIRREVICPGKILTGGKRSNTVDSDYVLIYQGRKLAAIEAKKESLSYTEGVRQAIDYAERLQCRFAYATNGHDIYQIDMETGEEGLVEVFLSPDDMWQAAYGGEEKDYTPLWRQKFSDVPYEMKGGAWIPRYYQENAINNTLDAIAKGQDRILLTLATGTGKTSIAFQLAWKLFHSRWSLSSRTTPAVAKRRPRILFLADRNILANQAFNDFGPFGEDAIIRIQPDEIRKNGKVPKNGSVFFTIFQTFMSGAANEDEENELEEATAYFGDYPADFFDFIVIDECHRGGANSESSWRSILNYFGPAVQLGLTATPKRDKNVDTYSYFGEPVYTYSLKEGINDGFLTPFKVHPIIGTMDEYIYTPGDGVVVKGDPAPGRVYKEGDFNRIITIPAREKKRVKYWMDMINPKQKTIVFCATQEHAGLVRDYINKYAREKGWATNRKYCVRVTANDGQAGETDLKTFQDNEKTIPTILTTSRKLSTGVDARNVRNIVLMRECKNMIEFKQIVGRGTRLFDGKEYFSIYDFVKAHHNFADPEWDGDPEPDTGGEDYPIGNEGTGTGNVTDGDEVDTGDEPTGVKRPEKIKITLSDGKVRQIKHVSSVMYWHGSKPISASEFIEKMFSDLPDFFKSEQELRKIWADPSTREKLLNDLAESGYDQEKLKEMKKLIDAEDSDVFDILGYVAYAIETKSRDERVQKAQPHIVKSYEDEIQRDFINFILGKYIADGVRELSTKNMKSLLELKYNTVTDATHAFGSPATIREVFIGFQKHLYDDIA
ncbi:MAG: DEAD/DEAH box helicase family protein [Lentisphaeraceae bacterium]|nr:DEAD/DEAH box helicase family protein [Lentisphaeraceae bacterium]